MLWSISNCFSVMWSSCIVTFCELFATCTGGKHQRVYVCGIRQP